MTFSPREKTLLAKSSILQGLFNVSVDELEKPSTTFDATFDCTQREIVVDIAAIIYRTHGSEISDKDKGYLYRSQHPTEQAVLQAAEQIFELFAGDSPDYSDEDEEPVNG
jgi:hypothetical protein